MKNSFSFLLFLSACLFFSSVQELAASNLSDPYLTKEFTLSGNGFLDVETSGASVAVMGILGNQVVVEMYVKKNGQEIESKNAEVEELLENYDLDISKSGNTISLKVKRKNNNGWSRNNQLNLSFKVQVPTEISSSFQSSGGSISIESIKGEQKIATSGGSIKVADASGELITQSSGGSFSLNDFEGQVSVQTSGGSVKVNGLQGNLKINTSGGSVTLEDISGGIDANTSGGSIRAKLFWIDEDLSFKTSGGSITAIVPDKIGLDLNLRGGRVNSKVSNFDGEIKKDLVVGKMNGGGKLLSMQSSGGSINLEFMEVN